MLVVWRRGCWSLCPSRDGVDVLCWEVDTSGKIIHLTPMVLLSWMRDAIIAVRESTTKATT
jgi:hypothetical protein